MIKSVTIAFLSIAIAAPVAAAETAAFGIEYGQPVPPHLVAKAMSDRTVRLSSVPSPYPDIEVYAAKTDAAGNVCVVTGYIPVAEQDHVEGEIAKIYLRMSEAYGDAQNARPGGDVNEAWLWFTEDKKQTVTLRRFLGPNFKRAASLEYYSVGSGCK